MKVAPKNALYQPELDPDISDFNFELGSMSAEPILTTSAYWK